MVRAPSILWEPVLLTGFDNWHDLHKLGVRVDRYDRPPRRAARAAWRRYGPAIMAAHHPLLLPPWGLVEFGRPWEGEQRDTAH